MNSEITLDSIIEVINKAKTVGIFTHISPDGDAIGSSLGLYLGLIQLQKEVEVVTDEYAKCFNFLPSIEKIRNTTNKKYDLTIALDCASQKRLYDPEQIFDKSNFTIAIDHHSSNTYFAKLNYIEENSPAVCKTLVKILKRLNINITKEIGECLMAGIITDSGGFRHDNVDDETFEFAASMLDIGVNISNIYFRTFDLKTKSQFKLLSIANSRLELYANGKIALTYVTQEDFKKVNASIGDHEGIVNVGQNVEGVLVSIFLREDEDGSYKISLRSNENVNVSEIAKKFDGGGHPQAAGCTITTTLEEAIKKIVKETKKQL